MESLKSYLQQLPPDFLEELEKHAVIKEFAVNTEILREGQYVKLVPLVLEGTVKVFTKHDDKELLLYYIESGESCIMSFDAGLKNTPSKVFALAEENTKLLLLPTDKLNKWLKEFPSLNELFYNLYNQRYASLLDTIHHLLFNRLDQRLYNYLLGISKHKGTKLLKIRHRQIAAELGTVREVISRVMKKLELEGKLRQVSDGIELI